MRRYGTCTMIILLFLAASSCTERIDLTLDPNYARLVVDGSISNDTGAFAVNLTRTADYFSNVPVPRITGATVTLSDGEETDTLEESVPGESGIYMTRASFYGVPGHSYTLHISLKEAVGDASEYTATTGLPTVPTLDSTAVEWQPAWGDSGYFEIRAWFQEPSDEVNYYLFNLYRNDTLLTDSLSKVTVSDDRFFSGQYIDGATVIYISNDNPATKLHDGDVITLQVSGITKDYYDFISQVQLSGISIPFFTGPPANVISNVDHGAVGFFAAYSNTRKQAVVRKQ